MVQRKYLIFFIIFFYTHNILSSAWLPTPGSYHYSISTLITDQSSKAQINNRIQNFKLIEEKLCELVYLKCLIYGKPNINQFNIEQKIDQKINKLKKILSELSSYTTTRMVTQDIEYGINSNSSLGVKIVDKEEQFIDSRFLINKKVAYSHSANITYKYKLYQDNLKIFTISPQIFINQQAFLPDQYYSEISFLWGISKKKKSYETFTETIFNQAFCLDKSAEHKNFYSLTITEGIKLSQGFVISNYTKYSFNKNFNEIYRKTLYEQISISKLLLPNNKLKNFTLQIGYFWDKSLSRQGYQTSGLIFSSSVDL